MTKDKALKLLRKAGIYSAQYIVDNVSDLKSKQVTLYGLDDENWTTLVFDSSTACWYDGCILDVFHEDTVVEVLATDENLYADTRKMAQWLLANHLVQMYRIAPMINEECVIELAIKLMKETKHDD